MIFSIKLMKNPSEIANCFDVYQELRPHLKDRSIFVNQIRQQQKEGFMIYGIHEEQAVIACIGFRSMTTVAWGRVLYIDDLITRKDDRGKGCASQLLTFAIQKAQSEGFDQVHLDTGYTRHTAHRVYLKHGFELNCHHMMLRCK